jgi:hypothetical protein
VECVVRLEQFKSPRSFTPYLLSKGSAVVLCGLFVQLPHVADAAWKFPSGVRLLQASLLALSEGALLLQEGNWNS